MRKKIANRVLACIARFEASDDQLREVQEGSPIYGVAGVIDSLELVGFLANVESEFGISISSTDVEVILDSLGSLNQFCGLVERLKSE